MKLFKFLYYLFKQHPKRIPIVLIVLTFSGLLESIGIGTVIPILEFFFQNRSYESDSVISQTIFSTYSPYVKENDEWYIKNSNRD